MAIDWLSSYADDGAPPVLTLPTGQDLTAKQLRRVTGEVMRQFTHPDKSLVLCLGDRDLGTVVAYLAAQRAGHAVAFLHGAGGDAPDLDLVRQYEPEYVVPPGPREVFTPWLAAHQEGLRALGYTPVRIPQPDLTLFRRTGVHGGPIAGEVALLLGTSGTTGSPQSVMISDSGLTANVDAIVAALGISARDRAVTSLPIRHSYGLSVLNTHLRAGATTLLTDQRPSAMRFWDQVTRGQVTSFAAVPTTYQFLSERHLDLIRGSAIRTMTQAGGRLPDDLVMTYWSLMRELDGTFWVMYGQTEATARMSVLDTADLPARIGSVGRAIGGGFFIDESVTEDMATRAGQRSGEICYDGPGIMLGYAGRREDLGQAKSAPAVLRTGDLGYVDDGYLYVTGRVKRIAKLFGNRVSLDEIERMLPPDSAAVSDDHTLYLALTSPPPAGRDYAREIATLLDVPERLVTVTQVRELPRTGSGKTRYPAVLDLVRPSPAP